MAQCRAIVLRTVLLLDDDAQFRASVTPALEACGLRVISASKGSIARALLEEEEPSLLVVDGLLPDTNGIVWIQELRNAGFRTPVIFVSAFYRDLATFRHLTRDLDVLKVFHKPVAVDRFAREVANTIVPPKSVSTIAAEDADDDERVVFPEEPGDGGRDVGSLKQSYRSILPIAADNLSGVIQQVQVEPDRVSLVSEALRQAHDLHGTAGNYGFVEISTAAASIESQLRKLQASGRVDWGRVYESVDLVRVEAARAVGRTVKSLRPSAASPPPVTPAAALLLSRHVPREFVPTLLVLEDDPAMIAYLRSAFDEILLHVHTVASVNEALKVCGRNPPSAVLIGWPLQDRDGLSRFLKLFRGLRGCSETPTILLSVDDDAGTRAFAADLGIDVFLAHPVDLVRLHHAVATAMELSTSIELKVAVLRDSDVAHQIERSGFRCLLYLSLDELLREIDAQRPDVVFVGSAVQDQRAPRILRMGAWDIDFALMCFEDSPLAKNTEIDQVVSDRSGWIVEVHRQAERAARVRRRRFRCSQTGLVLKPGAVAALESGLSAAQRHGRTYSVGFLQSTGLEGFESARTSRLQAHLGRLVARRFRREDVRGRWNDETFVVGFDGSSARAVVAVVGRLQKALEIERRREQSELSELHVAAGLAAYPLDGDTTRALVLSAQERVAMAVKRGPDGLVWR